MASSLVVLDIDGVLADVRHRLHYLTRRPKDWASFFAAADCDDVLEVGAQFARQAATTHDIVYLTGRPERLRAETQSWLESRGLPPGSLLMRPEGDRRPSAFVKLRELRLLRRAAAVDLVVDDDPDVVEAARSAGFTVQLADWMPTRATPDNDGTLFGVEALRDAQQRQGQT
jgi:uncharacterized HAD superfamily protein